ncbi:hypothetical protein PHSC3_001132 [Chlamydiales bacterium STE3]|nr:hypothetical protein PHSC3_001132 [Chlamydiales bacterium STE3]
MVSPNFKIDQPRDKDVKSSDDRYLKKDHTPSRDFQEVAEQVDEKRYREENAQKTDKKSTKKNDRKAAHREPEEERPASLFDLVRNTRNNKDDNEESKHSREDTVDEESLQLKKKTGLSEGEDKKEIQKRSNSEFIPERHDLSTVNPLSAHSSMTNPINLNTSLKPQAPVAQVQNLQEVFDRIAKEAYSLETSGKTETVVTLKGSLFDQSRLILSEFDSAKGEFNITIDNLTQAAKNALDMNQSALIDNLSKKGYMVHIMTTTTTIETPQIDVTQFAQDDSEKQNNPDEQNSGQKNQGEE